MLVSRRSLSNRHWAAVVALGVFVPLMGTAAGCDSAQSLCDRVCDCEGCSDPERESCYDFAEDTTLDADQEGCAPEYDDYVSCAHSAFQCNGGRAEYEEGCAGELLDYIQCAS